MSTTTIKPFPELRAYAEEEARDCHNRFASLTWGVADGWSELDDDAQATLLRLHVDRLCDFTRLASRDAVSWLVAERIGWAMPRFHLALETTGLIRGRLFRACGMGAGTPNSEDAADALARIVHALWPEVAS